MTDATKHHEQQPDISRVAGNFKPLTHEDNHLLVQHNRNTLVPAEFGRCDLFGKVEREVELVARSTVGGALKEAERDPLGTTVKVAGAVGTAIVLGAAATAASPWIAGGAAVVGIAGTGAWLWGMANPWDRHNVERNNAISTAVRETWNSNDRAILNRNIHTLEDKCGKDALDLGIGLLAGKSAGKSAEFAPKYFCENNPLFGFKFFSQHAIEKAFPLKMREFEITGDTPSSLSSLPQRLQVRELLGSAKGPEQSLVIAHHGSIDALPPCDLLATCHPETLDPMLRAKSILHHAGDVEMQVNESLGRLRFLSADRNTMARFVLGDQQHPLPFIDFMKELRAGRRSDGIDLSFHDLPEIQRSFAELPFQISKVLGAGEESIVFKIANRDDVVLKLSNPRYFPFDEAMGTDERPFDAKRIGEVIYGKGYQYVGYLQETAEPVKFEDVEDTRELKELLGLLRSADHVIFDKENPGQIGYTKDGNLRVIDWFAAAAADACRRDEELGNDGKPSR